MKETDIRQRLVEALEADLVGPFFPEPHPEAGQEVMFRDRKEWAVGHNTSVERPTPDASGKVTRLVTTQLPCFEVPRVDHRPLEDVSPSRRLR